MLAQALDKELRGAGLHIHGVSIGRKNDKKTWRVDWNGKPTDEQRALAQKIINDFDPARIPPPPPQITLEALESRLSALEGFVKPKIGQVL